jgi:hypothetical protein
VRGRAPLPGGKAERPAGPAGILGMDFLTRTGAIVNLHDLTLDYT